MTHPITDTFRLALAQLNPTVGDIAGNAAKARSARAEAAAMDADMVLYSELFIAGYPPEDLVLKPAFIEACEAAVHDLAKDTADGGPAMLIGTPWRDEGGVYNAVCLLDEGRVVTTRYKVDLPNYGVFDEKRVFAAGGLPGPIQFRGLSLGVPICEDGWSDEVCECLMETGAEMLLSINGSPYWHEKTDLRLQVMVARVVETGLPLVYLNQICGQDELIFEGASFGLHADRSLAFQMPDFEESVVLTVWKKDSDAPWRCVEGPMEPLLDRAASDWNACVLGLRDYVEKNGFPGVVLGLSGGIDSAVCAAMAVDALGPDRVHCIMMPYRYTSSESLGDAAACAEALGVRYDIVPIAEPVEGFSEALGPLFSGRDPDVTEENIQSRTRGTLLMAVSNKFGSMVVTTGNKSEVSVGYATLYGDMNGGFNPVKDLYKTEVFKLAAWRNEFLPKGVLGPAGEVIPKNIITKVPTAELRENQTDQDSLPPYEVLDDILQCLVENEMPVNDIVARGHDRDLVHRVEHLLYIAEYKRRQAAPGVKVTRKHFGRDRRYPITNRFRDRNGATAKGPKATS
ncbi:NAD+ synthase [Rhodobium orientis]|uniref:Glutamine-dependent NAD(+) synthetase n=1 Tax=Rhodobium orientis TaxID=34017 RepID=A0A327JVS9_9HYPH|nr:NAD+ synthase [Rhodobium orientis]MBB4304035.1 NAD+ synthase [Rhodobium orientis]MBK5950756.1 NAD+ synthase [Rhodobium orientis]RAI29573.1 NAD+ synthase [Rhodobium orientis]